MDWKSVAQRADKEELATLICDMVDIYSPMGEEEELANYLYERLKKHERLIVKKMEVEPGRHNVVATLKGTGGGPTLLYVGHMDTPFGGDEEGIKDLGPGYQPIARRDGDWIYGVGSYNMQSGTASAVYMLEVMADSGVELKGDVTVCCVVGETVHVNVPEMYEGRRYRGLGIGTYSMLRHGVTGDVAISPEPTSGRLSIASGGILYFQITTWGNPGATYIRGKEGTDVKPAVDAIEKMFKIIEVVKEWIPKYRESNLYMGEPATNAAIISIHGGLAFRPSKVAPICKLFLEVDTMPGMHNMDVVQEVEELIDGVRKSDPDMKVDIRTLCSTVGAEISPDEYIVKAIGKYHKDITNQEAPVSWDSWLADTTPLTRAGIPALCYGMGGRVRTGGTGYYAKEGEHCYVPDILEGVKIFIGTSMDICSMTREEYKKLRPEDKGTVIY